MTYQLVGRGAKKKVILAALLIDTYREGNLLQEKERKSRGRNREFSESMRYAGFRRSITLALGDDVFLHGK
jgi:hypothetical protein